jgi:oligopeptide transport system substrate-binding protein
MLILLSGCASSNVVIEPTHNPATAVPATQTANPTMTPTLVPSRTPLAGVLVLPLDTLDNQIPWLPMENVERPGTYMFIFNTKKPPFNNVSVRKALIAAIDRETLVTITEKYGTTNASPATSLTPPQTMARDLYNQIGIPFDIDQAKAYLADAGYTDPSKFPPATILINVAGEAAPGLHVQITDAMIKMWKDHLGITVTSEVVEWGAYQERLQTNPPEIVRLSWAADYNDPDNFLKELFYTNSSYNYGHFSNLEFDQLVDQAADNADPAERQVLYMQAEQILCEIEAAILPIYHATWNMP